MVPCNSSTLLVVFGFWLPSWFHSCLGLHIKCWAFLRVYLSIVLFPFVDSGTQKLTIQRGVNVPGLGHAHSFELCSCHECSFFLVVNPHTALLQVWSLFIMFNQLPCHIQSLTHSFLHSFFHSSFPSFPFFFLH